ncbi:AsmA family protein [Ramlibacter algicola]|uniref:AsmA family protein n=1 Tax=Ramlibacter algicola TaxID=2795217 RepID=A0A934Q530_9BURK|nr:AsmA family protein [Ramlibacter algicola]MBK0394409.1 AsmA family protein [Ramlibacter algicola]
MQTHVLARGRHSPWWAKVLLAIAVIALLLVVLIAFFPWDTLRGPINRYVTKKTGREFAITRHLDVKVGRTTRVLMDGVQFANPDWAQDRYLVRADAAEVEIRLLPLLLQRRIEMPMIRLTKPQLGLQVEPDGRKTWALGEDTKDEKNVPDIGAFVVDQGEAHYVAKHQGADVRAQFGLQHGAKDAADLPLHFKAGGTWREQQFTAEGRTGDVLYLSQPLQKPFPAEVQLRAGATTLQAHGSVASVATLDGANAEFRLQGDNLAQLYKLVGVVLPDTPRYSVAGRLQRRGETWQATGIEGKLGRSDIAGDLTFAMNDSKPVLKGLLRSKFLDFVDLAAVIGMDEDPKKAATKQVAAAQPAGKGRKGKPKEPRDPNRKVLPDAPLDVSRLKSMDADVEVDAARIVNAKGLPLDRMATHVRLRNGVLLLDPLNMGVAGGEVEGTVRIDANAKPVQAKARLDGRALELSKLVPMSESMRNSIGKLQAQVDLAARGASVHEMLSTSNGRLALLMGKGEISNLALEIAGLDGGEIIKFFTEGDRRVGVRCAVAAFDVDDGVLTSRALLFDTNDTVFNGAAKVNLGTEQMDIYIKPQPKDKSFLSLRSPLKVAGTFGHPEVGLDKVAVAKRALAAVGLGAVNPLMALFATIETGPGQDADCVATLKHAQAGRAEARVEKTAPPVAGAGGKTVDDGKRMGAGRPASAPKR